MSEEKIKILFVSHDMSYSGAPKSLLRMCRVACELGYIPVVWSRLDGAFVKEFNKYGMCVRILKEENLNFEYLKDEIRECALSICNTIVVDKYVNLISRYIPVIWYIREAGDVSSYLKQSETRRKLFQSFPNLVCVSDYARNKLKSYTKMNIDIVENCVEDISHFKKKVKTCNKVVRFIQFAYIHYRKGYDVLLDAFIGMPTHYKKKAELYFAGPCVNPEDYASEILEKAQKEDNVFYLGIVKGDAKKAEIYEKMDVVVVASRDEPCSLVALEGAMMSKPLILTENVGAKYIIKNGNGVIVNSDDVLDLRRAMMGMIDNKDKLPIMGEFSRKNYESMASMESYKEAMKKMFAQHMENQNYITQKHSALLFPYGLIPPGCYVGICGDINMAISFCREVKNNGWANAFLLSFDNVNTIADKDIPVKSLDNICSQCFDYILIAEENENQAKEIKRRITECGVKEDRIKWEDMMNRKSYLEVMKYLWKNVSGEEPRRLATTPKPSKTVVYEKISCQQEMKYLHDLEKCVLKNNDKFVNYSEDEYKRQEDDPKIIAWYLPQFYQMEVNDKYHGKGFTEWTNTSRMFPMFEGHYQPHVPYDVGYYDLTNPETIKRQVFLAKHYGVYGFAIHYYWFSGKCIMDTPLTFLLNHKEIDMPFCLSWATENWTNLWDGGNKEVIYKQEIKNGDSERFMKDAMPYFKDERYIKINGKPVLLIYRVKCFAKSDFKSMLESFRRVAKKNGLNGLYVMITDSAFEDDAEEWGADALVEYQFWKMAQMKHAKEFDKNKYLNPYFNGKIYDVSECILKKDYIRVHRTKKFYRSVLTSWDNSARKALTGAIALTGLTPKTFYDWMVDVIQEGKRLHGEKNNYIFVNSWNEWAEGSHMEPDYYYGYGWLESLKNAIINCRKI